MNTEQKIEKQASATSAELTQTELDEVAGGGTSNSQPVSLQSFTISKPIDQSSTPLFQQK